MNLTSTREAIHDALAWGYKQQGLSGMGEYLIYLTRIEKSIRRGDPCVDFLEAAYICAAINSLQPHLGGWLKFAYGPDDLETVQTCLSAKLRFDIFPICSAKKHQRYLALTATCLEGYRLRINQGKDLPVALYAERIGVDSGNWQRDYLKKQEACQRVIKIWDREAVGHVSIMVSALRGAGQYRPSEVISVISDER